MRSADRLSGGDYGTLTIGVQMPRETLYRRIDERVDDMIERGLVDELKGILDDGIPRDAPSLDTVGYKEWFGWLDGEESFEHCAELVKRDTRRYAKRQLTWFRARPEITWYDMAADDAAEKALGAVGRWLDEKR